MVRATQTRPARGTERKCITVTFFSAYYTSHGGGLELASEELITRLRDAGLAVTWLAQVTGALPARLAPHCIPISGTDVIYRVSGIPFPVPAPWAVSSIVRAASGSDVTIIAEANFILSLIAFLTAKLLRKPVLVIQHVGKPSTTSPVARLFMNIAEYLVVRPILRNANAVVCVSAAVARHFKNVRTSAPMTVIGHGIDTEMFRRPSSAAERDADRAALGLRRPGRWACFVGRLTGSKGMDVIAELARLRPDWNFAIAGIGPVSPPAWGLSNVFSLGYLNRQRVAQLYRACDVMVLPSPSESFSLVVREALVSGCGVLCSDQILDVDVGLADFITPRPVDLSDVLATAQDFAQAIDKTAEAGQPARDYVSVSCSWQAVLAKYLKALDGLVALARKGSDYD